MKKINNKLKRIKFYLFRIWVDFYSKTHKYTNYIGIVSSNKWKNKVFEDIKTKYYLNRQGYGVDIVSYEEQIDYKKYQALIIKSIWGYQKNKQQFDNFLKETQKKNIPIFNSVNVILNNYNKEKQFKLLDKYHIKHIDTIFIENKDEIEKKVEKVWQDKLNKYNKLVIKPTVSESSEDTYIISSNTRGKNTITLKEIKEKYQKINYKLMLQPYIEEVTNGEYSIVCFSNKLSHIIQRCVPVFNDKSYIKYIENKEIDQKMMNIVNEICSIPEYQDNLYMRIDLVKTNNEYLVIEVELLDPQLFLNSITSKDAQKLAYCTFTEEIIKKILKLKK